MIVLDANILIRAVLGRRVRQLLEQYSAHGIHFYAPDIAFADAQKYLPALLHKRGKPETDITASIEYLSCFVQTVTADEYSVFEAEARRLPAAVKARVLRCGERWIVTSCSTR